MITEVKHINLSQTQDIHLTELFCNSVQPVVIFEDSKGK